MMQPRLKHLMSLCLVAALGACTYSRPPESVEPLSLSSTQVLPDFSGAGYRGGQTPPRITRSVDARDYGVIADDGEDDSAALQHAIDLIGAQGLSSRDNHLVLQLPPGQIILSAPISVDVDGLIIRGAGSDPGNGGTHILFRPWRAYEVDDGTPDVPGRRWPGEGAFRVETRRTHEREPLEPGSINYNWLNRGRHVTPGTPLPGTNIAGSRILHLEFNPAAWFRVGDLVFVGAANTSEYFADIYQKPENMRRGLMRTQLFTVTAVGNNTTRTLTLDKPLEFDVPHSDGAAFGNVQFSKIMSVVSVSEVGFEDFYFSATLEHSEYAGMFNPRTYHPQRNPGGVRYRYENTAPEYALHGIVFKFAESSWVRNVHMHMTPSHPIVTEFARHITIEDSLFDGSWNKGKGGHGYFRLSRAFDSRVQNNVIRNLRHLALQWSASGNVISNNTLSDSDINLHGGWERNNLIIGNRVKLAYEHRSWGDDGPEGGTWYPLWWGTGPHASNWAGATGPNNIVRDNVFLKQRRSGGPYRHWGLYDRRGINYHFGWDGTAWAHLRRDGQIIDTWTHNEEIDFSRAPHSGVITSEVPIVIDPNVFATP